jgi:predicted N-acetyltransferase YhbS
VVSCHPVVESDPPRAKGIVLRPLTTLDAEEAAAVMRMAFGTQSRPTRPPSSALGETAASVAAKIDANGGVGVRADGRLVALALWQLTGNALHIGRVSVLPEWRGAGIGRELVETCEATARRLGAERMSLKARLELPENERFFERFGFRRYGVEAHPGFEAPTTALMEKPLS